MTNVIVQKRIGWETAFSEATKENLDAEKLENLDEIFDHSWDEHEWVWVFTDLES